MVELRTFKSHASETERGTSQNSAQLICDPIASIGEPSPSKPRPTAASVDAVEGALAAALEGATKASEWGLVAQLAKELEARRAARANVVVLRPRAKK